jgi:regulatory protein YycH of two-component signal transduction system YycFG
MIEKLKTVLLSLLVVLSLIQSYLLAYNKPDPNPINQPEYVRSELTGKSLSIEDLTRPKDIVLHFGEDKHTILYPEEYFFTLVMGDLKKVELSSVKKVFGVGLNQERMRKDQLGLEVRFHVPILPSMVRQLFEIEDGSAAETPSVRFDRIWFTKSPNDELHAYLLSDTEVYEVENVDLTVKDLEKNITFGQYRAMYKTENGIFYTPLEAINIGHRVKLPYTQYTSEQLRNSLFVDPGRSRSILQRDNTETITDGKRGLEINHSNFWIKYSDPVAPTGEVMDVDSNLSSALQFVNQNGGWSGIYMLHRVPESFSQSFRFIQYFESLPIIPTESAKLGYIQVTMTGGVATSYERSLINPEWGRVERSLYQLPGGETLERMLEQYRQRAAIINLFPAYEAIIYQDNLELVPRWAVELPGGAYEFLK